MDDQSVAEQPVAASSDIHTARVSFSIFGVGAVGGLLAAMLERTGSRIHLVVREPRAETVRTQGIRVESAALGNWTSGVHEVSSEPATLPTILAVKGPALPQVLPGLQAARPPEVLAVLNGVQHAQLLREALPHTRVVAASITVEAASDGVNGVEHRSPFVRLGVAADDADAELVQALQLSGVDLVTGGTEEQVLWRKFRFLAPMALLTAYHQQPLEPAMQAEPHLSAAVIAETAKIASRNGLPTTTAELTEALSQLPPGMRSSLQKDLLDGRPSELEQIGGALLAFAARDGIQAPGAAQIVHELRRRASLPHPT